MAFDVAAQEVFGGGGGSVARSAAFAVGAGVILGYLVAVGPTVRLGQARVSSRRARSVGCASMVVAVVAAEGMSEAGDFG